MQRRTKPIHIIDGGFTIQYDIFATRSPASLLLVAPHDMEHFIIYIVEFCISGDVNGGHLLSQRQYVTIFDCHFWRLQTQMQTLLLNTGVIRDAYAQ